MLEIENSSPTTTLLSPAADNQTKSDQPTKRKRNLPGMPDPDAEVIALSPKTLMATNRFVCEICNKGFQRDQNLQLHRRGHNLPWKLGKKTNKEVRKRVYVCPEITCIHHDQSRALGDLTGIKKHFCRKHGDKKYKCERCTKKYAVKSDWKAHMKVCGTREYHCDCGTLFSRRDSFITHRAFCDALALESARPQRMEVTSSGRERKIQVVDQPAGVVASPPSPPLTPSTGVLSPVLSIQRPAELPENQTADLQLSAGQPAPPSSGTATLSISTITPAAATTATAITSSTSTGNVPTRGIFPSMFNATTSAEVYQPSQQSASYSALICAITESDYPAVDPVSLSLSSSLNGASSLLQSTSQNPRPHYASSTQAALSATALLQKAAQMGAKSSNSSFLQGRWLVTPSPSPSDPQDNTPAVNSTSSTTSHANNTRVKLQNNSLASGHGLGFPLGGSSGFSELMMSNSTLFGNKPTTLDFLGLGMDGGEASSGEISAFLSSISGGLGMAATSSFTGVTPAVDTWDHGPSDRDSSML